jgi:uncharacterized Zn finger protein (UPF0148 family)
MGKVFRLRGKGTEPKVDDVNTMKTCPKCGRNFKKYKLKKDKDGKVVSRHCPYCNYKFPKKKATKSKKTASKK